MNVEIRHAPSFAVARAHLQPGEAIRAEAGAMMATSEGVAVESRATGGMIRSLKRSVLGGESFFVTSYTAPQQGGWVDCAARLPCDCTVVPVDGALNTTRRGNRVVDQLGGGEGVEPVVRRHVRAHR